MSPYSPFRFEDARKSLKGVPTSPQTTRRGCFLRPILWEDLAERIAWMFGLPVHPGSLFCFPHGLSSSLLVFGVRQACAFFVFSVFTEVIPAPPVPFSTECSTV